MKKGLLIVVLALSVTAYAKPAHVLYHVVKAASYPARHPQKMGHALWKVVTAVF